MATPGNFSNSERLSKTIQHHSGKCRNPDISSCYRTPTFAGETVSLNSVRASSDSRKFLPKGYTLLIKTAVPLITESVIILEKPL